MYGEFVTIQEAAKELGVSTRHTRRLTDSGDLVGIARGLIQRSSVDRYVRSRRQGRTRAWAEHTAWGAVAMLSGQDAEWLGTSQASRLRSALREINDVDELLSRLRDRARIATFDAHSAALPRLRALIAPTDFQNLGVSQGMHDHVDGYLGTDDLDGVARALGLRANPDGAVTLRTTRFDFDRVRELVATHAVAAVDAATDTDPRVRGAGEHTLRALLKGYR